MKRRGPQQPSIDLRKILEAPVAKVGESGHKICAYEASRRRDAENAATGDMRAAKRFLYELAAYGLLPRGLAVDDHQSLIKIPKEWDEAAWHFIYEKYGAPPWPGERDGLIPKDRWVANYGSQVRPRVRRRAGGSGS